MHDAQNDFSNFLEATDPDLQTDLKIPDSQVLNNFTFMPLNIATQIKLGVILCFIIRLWFLCPHCRPIQWHIWREEICLRVPTLPQLRASSRTNSIHTAPLPTCDQLPTELMSPFNRWWPTFCWSQYNPTEGARRQQCCVLRVSFIVTSPSNYLCVKLFAGMKTIGFTHLLTVDLKLYYTWHVWMGWYNLCLCRVIMKFSKKLLLSRLSRYQCQRYRWKWREGAPHATCFLFLWQ